MSTAGIMEPDVARKQGGGKKPDEGLYVHAAPEVSARPWQEGDPDIPAAVTSFHKAATVADWKAIILYAKGIKYSSTDRYRVPVHTFSVTCTRSPRVVSAVWESPVSEDKIKWKFSYAGTLGLWVMGQTDGNQVASPFPFTLTSSEAKALVKKPSLQRRLVMDVHYKNIKNENKDAEFISESEFRTWLGEK